MERWKESIMKSLRIKKLVILAVALTLLLSVTPVYADQRAQLVPVTLDGVATLPGYTITIPAGIDIAYGVEHTLVTISAEVEDSNTVVDVSVFPNNDFAFGRFALSCDNTSTGGLLSIIYFGIHIIPENWGDGTPSIGLYEGAVIDSFADNQDVTISVLVPSDQWDIVDENPGEYTGFLRFYFSARPTD